MLMTGPFQQIVALFGGRVQFEYINGKLICPKKNIVIEVASKPKLSNDKSRFEEYMSKSHYTIGLFISLLEPIPFDVITNNDTLIFYTYAADLTKRFIDMLVNKPDLTDKQMNQIALENCRKIERESFIDKYDTTDEGFLAYAKSVPKSKVEYEKAKNKWPILMNNFKNKTQYVEWIQKMQSEQTQEYVPGVIPQGANKFPFEINTLAGFYDYVLKTPVANINKKTIKQFYPSVDVQYTHINEIGDTFKKSIKALHDALKAQYPVKN